MQRGYDQSNPRGSAAQKSRQNTAPSPLFVGTVFTIKIFDDQLPAADDPIIGNQDTGDGAQATGIAEQPIKDVPRRIGQQLPWLHGNANQTREQAAAAEIDDAGECVREIVGGRYD